MDPAKRPDLGPDPQYRLPDNCSIEIIFLVSRRKGCEGVVEFCSICAIREVLWIFPMLRIRDVYVYFTKLKIIFVLKCLFGPIF
jgi:hypothetical protein